MTAYDIFSAVGDISDDMLEESEAPAKPFPRANITRIPMIAAAACLAIFAFGFRYMYYDSGIEQPAATDSLNAITTDTPPVFSDLVSDTEKRTNETSVTAATAVTTVPDSVSEESSSVSETSAEISSKTYSTAAKDEEITESTKKTVVSTAHTEKTEKTSETVTAGTSASETTVTETAHTQSDADIIISIDTGTVPEENTSYIPNPGAGGHETSHSEAAGTSFTESTYTEITGDDETVDDDEDDDEAYAENYIFLDYGGSRYTQVGEFFDRSELAFLCAGEIYDIIQPKGERVGKSCEIYKINGMSEKYMLAVPTDEGYVGYRNFGYKPDSLAGYIEDTDYLNRTLFTAVKADEKGGSIKYTLPDIGQAIERLVYSNPTAAEIPYTEITGTTVYSICGAYGGISAFIYESGYVFINNRMFFVGGEYTAAFGEYIKNNAESSEFISHTQNGDTVNDEEDPDANEDIMEN